MKKFLLMAIVTLVLASCGTSPKSGINVIGRWYEYTDDSCNEVDSTSYFEFYSNQQYDRRYHDAGSLETGTYACTDKTKNDYGDRPAKRVSVTNQAGESYFVDMVQDGKNMMFVITYQMNDKQDIKYFVKDEKGNFQDMK